MIRFSSLVAAAALGLAAATLGASILPAAEPASPAAGSVGALTLERTRPLLSAKWLARVGIAAQLQRDRATFLADQFAAADHARLERFLAGQDRYAYAPADIFTDTRAVETVCEAAVPASAAPSLAAASSPLPSDYAGIAYDSRPVAAELAVVTILSRESGESFSARAVPNDYAATAAPVRASVWVESAAPAVNASSRFPAPSAWVRPALLGSATSAVSTYSSSAAQARLATAAAVGFSGQMVTSAALSPIALASSNGNASTQTASFGITPSAGTQQFLLTTINPAGSLPTSGYGTTPANTNVTSLNTYFELAAGTLAGRGAADGSGYLSQQVSLSQGNVVSFDYVFLTDEDNTLTGTQYHNDQAFFTVNGVINTTLYQAGQFSAAQLDNGSGTIFSFQTPGYVTINYTVPTTGNYTFGFGVIDVGVNTIKSGLLIDNLNYSAVPEPGTWLAGAMTVLLGAGTWKQRTRRATV